MRVTKPAPPNQVSSALNSGLAQYLEPDDPWIKMAAQCQAHEVFSLGLDEIASHAGNGKNGNNGKNGKNSKKPSLKQSAKSVGWRFIASRANSGMLCHVSGAAPKLTSVSCAPELGVMCERIQEIDGLTRNPVGEWGNIPEQNYEMRSLRIPGLLLEALWLHCPDHPECDHVVPLAGFTQKWDLNCLQPYSQDVFVDRIAAAARERLKAHNKLNGQNVELPAKEKAHGAAGTLTYSPS